MRKTCPCCGGDIPDLSPLVVSTKYHTVARHGRMARASRRVVALAAALQGAGECGLSVPELCRAVLGRRAVPPGETPNLLSVYISHLRRVLASLGARVEKIEGPRYRIVEDD
jgi:DNA-binding response OmpR family regulator